MYLGHIDRLLQPSSLPISMLSHALPDSPLKPLPFQTLCFLLYNTLGLISAVRMYFVAWPSTEIVGFIRGHILKKKLTLPALTATNSAWVGACAPLPIHAGMVTGLTRSYLRYLFFFPFMHSNVPRWGQPL